MIPLKCVIHLLKISTLFKIAVFLAFAGSIYILVDQTMFRSTLKSVIHKESPYLVMTSNNLQGTVASNCQVQGAELKRTKSETKNVYNCSVLDFLSAVDPTAMGYDSDLVCDELSDKYDIVCRLYLRQVGLESLESTICPLDNLDKVPRIVYYVIFGEYKFRFLHYVSMVAAKRFLSPRAIYVIGDQHPTGKWWQEVLKNVHGIRFLYRELPGNISGQLPSALHHLSDIVRLQILHLNGGIFLDADLVILKDLRPLLDHDVSLALIDNSSGMGNAFMLAKRRNSFIQEWYAEYLKYKTEHYFYLYSLQVPRDMWLNDTHRVHVEKDNVYRPNWFQKDMLFNSSGYPWQNNIAIHIWSGTNLPPDSPEAIATANTTAAEIFRYVLYGDHGIRKKMS